MDITTFTMILIARLSALAFCYSDGALPDTKLSKDQIEKKVIKMPSVIEMLSYTYYCC